MHTGLDGRQDRLNYASGWLGSRNEVGVTGTYLWLSLRRNDVAVNSCYKELEEPGGWFLKDLRLALSSDLRAIPTW